MAINVSLQFLNSPDVGEADQNGRPGGLKGLIVALSETGRFFTMGDRLFVMSQSGARIEPLKDAPDAAGHQLAAAFELQLTNAEGEPVPLPPNVRNLGAAIQARAAELLPGIKNVVHGPVFHVEGDRLVLAKEGLDTVRRELVLAPRDPLILPPVDESYPHHHAVFSGLLFPDPVHLANLLGISGAMSCRTGIDEFPMILIDSAQKSSGKSKIAEALCYLLLGQETPSVTYTGSEADFEVKLGARALLPGPQPIFVDNVRAKRGGAAHISSQAISSGVHRHFSMVHKMYKGQVPLFDPIFILTMNGARVEGDLSDKAVIVTVYRPSDGNCHRAIIPHPPDYVREFRPNLLAERLHILSRIRLDPINTSGTQTGRFYIFEQVAVKYAAALGLQASFSPDRVRTADTGVDELLGLLHSDLEASLAAGRVATKSLTEHITANPDLRELNAVLRCASRSLKGKVEALREFLLNFHHKRKYLWKGTVYALEVDGMDLLIQRTQL